jgi:hypothetical protein
MFAQSTIRRLFAVLLLATALLAALRQVEAIEWVRSRGVLTQPDRYAVWCFYLLRLAGFSWIATVLAAGIALYADRTKARILANVGLLGMILWPEAFYIFVALLPSSKVSHGFAAATGIGLLGTEMSLIYYLPVISLIGLNLFLLLTSASMGGWATRLSARG